MTIMELPRRGERKRRSIRGENGKAHELAAFGTLQALQKEGRHQLGAIADTQFAEQIDQMSLDGG